MLDIWCEAPFPVVRQRFAGRANTDRHPGHVDHLNLPELDRAAETARPLGLGAVLTVPTDRRSTSPPLSRGCANVAVPLRPPTAAHSPHLRCEPRLPTVSSAYLPFSTTPRTPDVIHVYLATLSIGVRAG